ncbi:MAG: hypothetical protein DRP45_04300 [Candidatus Zixiibacteriota bacterium]|nr:MAG: hypothetical protein DRP45_04300 [candidate division Zixibacteria bacterium]
MRLSKKIKRSVTYAFVSGLLVLFNAIPRRVAICLGSWIGLVLWRLFGRERHRMVRHLTLAYGDTLSLRQKEKIGQTFCVNTGRNLADVIRFRKHFEHNIKPLITAEGMEHFETANKRGKGIIGVTGHIGNFELMAAFIQSQGYNCGVIGREMYDERLGRLLIENRKAVGLTCFSTTDSPKKIISWIRQGNVLGVLIDTDSHRVRSEFIPAFGRWSNTPIGQTILGLKTGATFIPAACLRTEDNRYHVIVRPPVEIEPSGDFDTDVYNTTLACTKALEEIIHEHKDQWIWLHNRWHTERTIPGKRV